MDHILIPTDLSQHSLDACAYALDLFGTTGTRYTLVHAYMDPLPGYAGLVEMSSVLHSSSVEGLVRFTERVRALKGGADAVLGTQVVHGPLASSLMPLCKQRNVTMIVMGTRGASNGGRLFGSNAGDLARSSDIPVLVVPEGARYKPFRKILFADDHVRVEPLAMRPMITLAQRTGASILVAHVLRNEAEEPDARVVADLEETLAHVPHSYVDASGRDVAMALSEVAGREGVEAVAVLHRHLGMLDSLFHGSVARQLAMHSHIPLLVLQH